MNIESKSTRILKRQKRGYTLVETLLALIILTMLTTLALSTLFFFNQIRETEDRLTAENQTFEKLHLYFQRQIENSETICIQGGCVYLQDMETSKYYNMYQLKTTGILYRIKTKTNLKPIGGGESSQLESGIKEFTLQALTDRSGSLSGCFLLHIVFQEEEEKIYETVITYPGGTEKILLL